MTLKYYTMPGTIGVAPHIALEEIGASYELVNIDFAKQEQCSEAYGKINPKLRVPTLVVGDEDLSETPAILRYLAQTSPNSILALPSDPLAQAKIDSFNVYLASTVHVAHAHKLRGTRWCNDDTAMAAMTDFVPTSMARCFEQIESSMIKGPWVHGDDFSISDPYLFAICRWLPGDKVDIDQYPTVNAHYQRMLERASVQKVIA